MAVRIDEMGFGGLRIVQDTEQFCYGIDAVLLADFASRKGKGRRPHGRIVELGTNNGAVLLILSRLTDASLTGVEVQAPACSAARRSIELNGLESRMNVINCDVIDIINGSADIGSGCDAVVMNPPYTARGRGIVNRYDALTIARHETTADLEDFIKCAAYILNKGGTLYTIHRPERIVDISEYSRKYSLEPKVIRMVRPRAGDMPNLMLVECRKDAGRELRFMEPLTVYGNDGNYTEDILKIYRRK